MFKHPPLATAFVLLAAALLVQCAATRVFVYSADDGATITSPRTVSVFARITDLSPTEVNFYRVFETDEGVQSLPIGSDSELPYEAAWPVTAEHNGTNYLVAIATDETGHEHWARQMVQIDVNILGRSLAPPGRNEAGVETVCAALGNACVCSEPLDTDQDLPPQSFVDPVDSGDLGCDGEQGDQRAFYAASGGAAVPSAAFPAQADVTWVWRVEYLTGGIANVTGNALTLNEGTVCTRIYQRFSSDYPSMGQSSNPSNERNKLLEMSGPWGQFQTQFWPPNADAAFSGHATLSGIYDANFEEGPDHITISDCTDRWCRMEQCIDRSGGAATFRVRAAVVGGSKVSTGSSGAVAGVPALDISRMWIGNLFREEVTFPGERFISHGIQAEWPTVNGTRWIGPACEIEGKSEWSECE